MSNDVELNPGPGAYRGIGDSVLYSIGQIIQQKRQIERVGQRLGISQADIKMYVVLPEGAYLMLVDWKKNILAIEQYKQLISALKDTKCQEIAGLLVSSRDRQLKAVPVNPAERIAGVSDGAGFANAAINELGAFAAGVVKTRVFISDVEIEGTCIVDATEALLACPMLNSPQQNVPLTSEMISMLLQRPFHCHELSQLGVAMAVFSPDNLNAYRRQNESRTNSEIEDMIKEWREKLQDLNQVAALCELLARANMKPRADEFYHQCDRNVSAELLKALQVQCIVDLSLKNIKHEDISSFVFDENGGQLHNDNYGIKLDIPPGALPCGASRRIALRILTEMPNALKLNGSEMIASFGFQCYPSGLKFKTPVTLTLPHCIDFIDIKKCKVVLYLGHDELYKSDITRIELTPDTCLLRENDFVLKLTHFSWGFFALHLDWIAARGINMLCMPFLPRQMANTVVMEIRLYKNVKGCNSIFAGAPEERNSVRACLDIAQEFIVSTRNKSSLDVSYQIENENEVCQSISYEEISQIVKEKSIYFPINIRGRDNSNLINMWLRPYRTHPIIFMTEFDTPPTTPHSSSQSKDTQGPPESPTNDKAIPIAQIPHATTVSEDKLIMLSALLPSAKYINLCSKLGVSYNAANNVLALFNNNYEKAYLQVLIEWKNRAQRSTDELKAALQAAKLGGFCDYI